MQFIKKYWLYLVVFAMGVVAGWFGHSYFTAPAVITKTKTIELPAKVETVTEIVYVQKEYDEKTDVDLNVGKQELNVKVNGKDFEIKKADNEQYVFDKNKLQLNQTSRADLNITVPTIDKTKRWGAGIGYSNNGIGYVVKVPAGKVVDAWGYADKDTRAAGVMVGF